MQYAISFTSCYDQFTPFGSVETNKICYMPARFTVKSVSLDWLFHPSVTGFHICAGKEATEDHANCDPLLSQQRISHP